MSLSRNFKGISHKEIQGLIERAMQDIDRNGYPANRKSTTYDVVGDGGKKYPPKEVLRRAAAFVNRDVVGWLVHKGGDPVNNFYEEHGFMILDKKGKIYKSANMKPTADAPFVMQETKTLTPRSLVNIFDDGEVKDIEPRIREAIEGDLAEKKVMARKRNRMIADERKRGDGYKCLACKFSYNKQIVECHHLKPMAMSGQARVTLDDLITLCPTCHRLAHSLIDRDYDKYTDEGKLIGELKNIRQNI